VTGVTDSYGANYTSQIWKCTVGSQVFHVAFSYDVTTNVNDLFITPFEAWDGSDGGGVPGAKKLRRQAGGGTTAAVGDATAVTPGATDVVSNADVSLLTTSPDVGVTNILGAGSAFNYLFKVGNKSVTIGYNVAGANRWIHVGAFESLVTGPADTMPLGMFAHGINTKAKKGVTLTSGTHADGIVTRNPGLGVTAEAGAFFAAMWPLHAGIQVVVSPATVQIAPPACGFGAAVPRWYTKVLMSQAVIHQAAGAQAQTGQLFRGYYPDLFAAVNDGVVEPIGGGVDSVVIDGVTYYWLGYNCPGPQNTAAAPLDQQSSFIAIRAD